MTRKPFTTRGQGLKPRKVISAAGLCTILMIGQTTPIMANPTDGTVVAGSATIGAAGQTLTINQSSGSAIINWQQFSIAGGETTKFIVPSALSTTLNRVTGGNPSAIYGNLQSNGILYLVNPSGIVVGPNGRIDTAGFMASTLDISNQQFLAGGDLHFTGDSKAGIDNQGTIHSSTGDVYLIANHVDNEGKITAPQGTAGLAAGNDVLFQQAGSQHLFVKSTPAGTKRATGVTNSGTIAAAAAELKAAGGNAYALAINNAGSIAATGFKKVGGQVYLTSEDGNITNSGRVSAMTSTGNGGKIVVDGTGVAGTGKVVNSGTLDASARVAKGHGGSVTLKSKTGTAINSGAILAKGGQGGVGGDVDVSGASVSLTGTVNTTALDGTMGNFLLDPASLTVVASGGTGTISGGANSSDSTINASVVDNALATTNVTLQADNTIDIEAALTWTSNAKLTLQTGASGSTTINATITAQSGSVAITSPTLTLNQSIIASTVSGTGVSTVNVGSSTGITSSGRMVTDAVKIAAVGATVNLHAGSTYALDTTTNGVTIDHSLTVAGNGATLDGQSLVSTVLDITNGATVVVGNLTVANAYAYGVDVDYNNVTATFNNVTVTGSGGMGIYNYYTDTLNLNNCTISGNGTSTSNYAAGGIENLGALVLDANTTVTGNNGLYTGGIYNGGTVTGNMTSTNIHGNTETYSNLLDSGADLFNAGTGTYVYKPDGEANNTYTITASIYSSGTGAVVTVDPSLTTLNVNAPLDIINSATFNSSATTVNVNAQVYRASGVFNSAATTVNVAAGSGTENGFLVQGGVALAGNGGTVNLHSGATYNFDNTTGDLAIGKNVTIAGNGATINGQNVVSYLVDVTAGATVALGNLTIEGSTAYGFYNDYNNATSTLNNVTISGNTGAGIYNYYTDTLNLNNCTITGNDGNNNYYSGGIYNAGTLNLDVNTTVTGNTGYYAGGIFNSGTIVGAVTSTNVHDNASTSADVGNSGANFYNSGTGSFVYKPDGEANNAYTVTTNIYSSGANAIVTVDPSLTTFNINAEMNIINSSVFNGSATTININAPVHSSGGVFNSAATTVNVAAGSGTENGYLVQGGIAFAASGGTVNLHSGTTYNFDGTTSNLVIAKNVTVAGNGATINGQNAVSYLIDVTSGATVTLGNLTVENSNAYGIYVDYNNVIATLNNVTITGNANSGIYNYYTDSLTLNNCTITNNGSSTYSYTAGGIYNAGTLNIDGLTTVTGNTGYQSGGIYNSGTIVGTVTSTQVHGNTATYSDPTNLGTDFYNSGSGTFEYKPDGEANNTLTIAAPIYSSGANAVITIDPTLTTVNLNSPVNVLSSSVVNSSATTVNVAAGTGTNNGYMIQGAVRLAAVGGAINLHSGTTYALSGTTSGLTIDKSVSIAGNGAILDGHSAVSTVVDITSGATVTLSNLTIENGTSYGLYLDYNNVVATLNGVTVTGNAGEGIYNYYTDDLTLNSSTISGNGSSNNYTAGGIYNAGTLHFDSATTVTGNTGYQSGGIYNSGTILGTVTSTQVHGNTANYTSPTNIGADFYNGGTGTFELKPDGEANNTLTVTSSIYSYGSTAVVTVDPTLTTLIINAPVNILSGSVVNTSATTVNVAAGSGSNNGYLIQSAINLAASGGTVNLHSGTIYSFDDTTGGLTIAKNVNIAGNGATLDGTNVVYTGIDIGTGATVTLGNFTLKNDVSYGIYLDYNNVTATLNNVTLTGITGEAIFNYYTNTLNINNSTITGNGNSNNSYTAGGIYNEGILNLSHTTIAGNTGYDAGGVYNSGTIIATDSTISGNTHTITSYGDDLTNFGTYTSITDASASTPNVFTYSGTSDYNGGTAIYQAPTINWNKTFVSNGVLKLQSLGSTGAVNINNSISEVGYGSTLIQGPVITLNAPISSTTGNIVLVASSQFVNNVGANALSTTNGYTWQVWSVNSPTSGQTIVDNDNGLTPNFTQTNATYGTTTVTGSGNGFFYSNGAIAGNDTLSGIVYSDSGSTFSVGTIVNLIFNGTLLGSTTTGSGGTFSFSIAPADLSGGILLTDATVSGNTYYQANSPSAAVTGINIWGGTLRINADAASNSALGAAAGSLSGAGINFAVSGANLVTNSGINMAVLSKYAFDGNVTANGSLTISSGSVMTGTGAFTLAANSMNLGGSITTPGKITVNSAGNVLAGAAISAGGFVLQNGSWIQVVGQNGLTSLPTFTDNGDFELQNSSTFERFAGGAGNANSPYQITDIYGLQGLGSPSGALLGTQAKLINDIDASGTTAWNSGAGFVPIGLYDFSNSSDGNTFSGVLNGQNHTISGLFINRPNSSSGTGLFGDTASGSTVSNLNLTGLNITGDTYVGGVAGVGNSTFSNISASGTVTGGTYVGGLFGITSNGISGSHGSVTVDGTSYVGGLVGFMQFGSLTTSYATGTVTGGANGTEIGGLVGVNAGTISSSYSTGSVSGRYYLGGLVGDNRDSISNTFSTASVTSVANGEVMGGLVGFNEASSTISNSYSAGTMTIGTGTAEAGAFVGVNQGTINNGFFDTDSTGSLGSNGSSSGNVNGLTAATTSDLESQSFIQQNSPITPGFDFATVWTSSNSNTPQLSALPATSAPSAPSNGTGTLSGIAYTDSGVTFSAGALIDLILNGVVLGSTTTDSSGNYSFSITTSNLTSGLLLTDAADHGNTYYQLNSPSGTTFGGIDIWGNTLIVNANTVNNAALMAAAGSLSQNGINYLVTGSNLATNTGINMVIQHGYQLDGNVTAAGTLTTGSAATLTGNTDVTLTGAAVNMAGTFAIAGGLTVTSTAAPIDMELSDSDTATANSLTLNSAHSITINGSTIKLNGGDFVATGDASAIGGDGVVILNTAIDTEGGSYNITGTAGNFNGTAGIGVDINNSSLETADLSADGSNAPTTGNITLNGISNLGSNFTANGDLIGVAINHSVVTLINGAMSVTGTVSSGTASAAVKGVYLADAAVVTSTGHGTVSLTGTTTGAIGSSDNYGVDIDGASIVSAANGSTGNLSGIHITGTAGDMANESQFAISSGIAVLDGSTVSGFGSAPVSLVGIGGADTDNSMEEGASSSGIFITAQVDGQTSSITTESGALSLNGTAGSSARFASGINMYGPNDGTALLSSTSGNITVTGSFPTAVVEGRELDGVIFQTGTEVTTASGMITVNGSVNHGNADLTSSAQAHGVYLSGSTISATTTGSVAITGDTTGAIGNYSLGGVLVQDAAITTGVGSISVTGTASTASTVSNSLYGVNLDDSSTVTATVGSVALTGTVSAGSAGSKVTGVNVNSGTSVTGGDVTLTGDTRSTTSLGVEAGVVVVNAGTTVTANDATGIIVVGHAGDLLNGATTIVDDTDNVTYEQVTVGISVNDGATLTTTDSAPITLTGFGGANSSHFASTTGYVDPTTGGTSGSHGVAIFNPTADTTTSVSASGDLTITGTAGSSPISGTGVVVGGTSNAGQASLTSATGDLSLIGTGGAGNSTGSTSPNAGVAILDPGNDSGSVSITATTGSIIVTGTGGVATNRVAINAAPYFNLVDNSSSIDPTLTAGTSIEFTSLAGDIVANGLAGGINAPLTTVTTPEGTLSTLTFGSNSGVVVLNGCDFVVSEFGGGVTFGPSVVTNISISQNVQEGETPGDTTLSSLTTRSLTITAVGNVNLNGAINAIHGPTGTTSVINVQTTGGNIVLGPGGSITGSGVGNDVILAAGTNLANSRYFINHSSAGANAIALSNGAHFYLYSADPTYDTLGGLTVPPENVIFNAIYTTTGLPGADQQLYYVASANDVGPNAPGAAPAPTPTTGSGSNIVPPQLTPNQPPITYVSGNLGNLGAVLPSPISYTGNGSSGYSGQQSGDLANSSGSGGVVGAGDAAGIGGGNFNNVSNPRASAALNQALGPAAYHNLASALADLGDWTDAGSSVPDGDSAGGVVQETVISAGDVVEVGGKGVKKVAPGQAPEQLKNALKGFNGGQ